MGKITGFLEIDRHDRNYAPVSERLKGYGEFVIPLDEKETKDQAARCMNCGIPYCHGTGSVQPGTPGCPVNNQIPDWNDLVYNGNWEEASRNLHSTNNFPEITGRICPAPCEASCTLNIDDNPVTIKTIECAIVDKAWENGWLKPEIAPVKTGKKIAVVGSGPAGMACAQQLARAGHDVHLFEKNDRIGGLLRYGIPDFKMGKTHIDRRVAQMEAEGAVFRTGVVVGEWPKGTKITNHAKETVGAEQLKSESAAVLLAAGSEASRDLPVPGRALEGVQYAMEFLPPQ
ncbi:MAG: glutamate synthase subunit beta, partial [Tardiphaga sp.]|uniref:glutamate synthase subunit beta n=1 Tax=Tardiphaga sp. TaxID=1926292 RepID=UPI0019CA6755